MVEEITILSVRTGKVTKQDSPRKGEDYTSITYLFGQPDKSERNGTKYKGSSVMDGFLAGDHFNRLEVGGRYNADFRISTGTGVGGKATTEINLKDVLDAIKPENATAPKP